MELNDPGCYIVYEYIYIYNIYTGSNNLTQAYIDIIWRISNWAEWRAEPVTT